MHRVAVISDVHGNLPALREVVADLNGRQVDRVINLGDHVSGPLWPKETIQFLMTREWIQLSGNMDAAVANQPPGLLGLSDAYAFRALDPGEREWLRSLPGAFQMGEALRAFHGTPSNNAEYLLESIEQGKVSLATRATIEARLGGARASVMVCGHSHIPRIVELSDGTIIVNPGSVGLPAYSDDRPEPHVIECGSPHARYAILEMMGDRCVAQLIAVPYDSQRAVEQARRNDRNDWAMALESGLVAQ